jgi:hypothetical protein
MHSTHRLCVRAATPFAAFVCLGRLVSGLALPACLPACLPVCPQGCKGREVVVVRGGLPSSMVVGGCGAVWGCSKGTCVLGTIINESQGTSCVFGHARLPFPLPAMHAAGEFLQWWLYSTAVLKGLVAAVLSHLICL